MPQIVIKVTGKNPIKSAYALRVGVKRALNQSTERVRQDFVENERGYTGGINLQLDRSHDDYQEVYSKDFRFYLTNVGTKPHVIAARPGGSLVFNSAYSPATQVRAIATTPAQAGGNTVHAKSVKHPGVDAREVHKVIADKHRAAFIEDIKSAILKGFT